jgi:hypothetical protein
MMMMKYILPVVIFVLLLLIIVIIVCNCIKRDTFVSDSTVDGIHRPSHPPWYKDIPESHKEVKELERLTMEQSSRVPLYTPKGFEKRKMPQELFDYLLNVSRTVDRQKEGKNNIFRRTSSGPPPYIIPISPEKKKWVHTILKPILEEWSGIELEATSAYGPREYRRGSSLRMHVDTEGTHIISVILHIEHKNMDKDWPLVVINRDGDREEIFMNAGDMVLYESASLPHSREQELKGDYYVNMFIHFKPKENNK